MGEKELESSIVNAVKEATSEIFSTMLMLDVKVEESFRQDEKKISTDLISSLHFFGERYMGKIAVFTTGAVACRLAGAMLGMEATEVSEEVRDCMGEIGNMIAGGAKSKLEASMGVLHLLTPWVISGKKLSIASPVGGEGGLAIESQAQFSWIMTRFITENKHFDVGIQPNAVPHNQSHLDMVKKMRELEEENERLKKEIKTLKA